MNINLNSTDKRSPLVMVIDDESGVEVIFSKILCDNGYHFRYCPTVEQALPLLRAGVSPEVIFLDIRLPGADGVSALPMLLKICPSSRIIMMTAYQTVDSVVSAMKSGAVDYLVKPLNPQMILQVIEKYGLSGTVSWITKGIVERTTTIKASDKRHRFLNQTFVAHSPLMKNLLSVADKFAQNDGVILLLGESGTGKELLAHYIHQKSSRSRNPFVVVDCASIPESLFESELFGYEKGAFTGADTAKIGRLELAKGGTLFLDEIGNVPLNLQAKLLRFIQDHTISRLGGKSSIQLDLRLITATNENVHKLITNGRFREDLYYRLSALTIHLPPLRNRPRDEKEFLLRHFLDRNAKLVNKSKFNISDNVVRAVLDYPWPGNIRELENALYSASILCDAEFLEFHHLPVSIQSYFDHKESSMVDNRTSAEPKESLRKILEKVEKEHILNVIKQTRGNKKRAAEILDMDYKSLLAKLKRYGQE